MVVASTVRAKYLLVDIEEQDQLARSNLGGGITYDKTKAAWTGIRKLKLYIQDIKKKSESVEMVFSMGEEPISYCIYKGSIGINGVSLTISAIDNETVTVSLIPHTLENTNLCSLKIGDSVNIASRLENISPEGGICISGKFYNELIDKSNIKNWSQRDDYAKFIRNMRDKEFGNPDIRKILLQQRTNPGIELRYGIGRFLIGHGSHLMD